MRRPVSRRGHADAGDAARARIARLVRAVPAPERPAIGGWVPAIRNPTGAPGPDYAGPDPVEQAGAAPDVGEPAAEPSAHLGGGLYPGRYRTGQAASAFDDHLPLWMRAAWRRLLGANAHSRVSLDRGHAVLVVVVVALAVISAAAVFWLSRPRVEPVGSAVLSTGAALPGDAMPSTPGSAVESAPTVVTVHVAGEVNRPGVVELPGGSRVVDAIEAAGGAIDDADLTPLNLARQLSDGEQILVGVDPPPPPAGATGGGDGGPAGHVSDPIDLNTATLEQLDTLPGIGPALAQNILDWREQNGRFTSVDELNEVTGIGEKKYAEIAPLVRV